MDEPVRQFVLGLGAILLGGGIPLVAFARWVWKQPTNGQEWIRRRRGQPATSHTLNLLTILAAGLLMLLAWGIAAVTEAAAVLW